MKKLLIILSVFMVFSACSKLEDLNKNTKDFTTVSSESLFNGATRALVNQLHTCNVNNNNTLLLYNIGPKPPILTKAVTIW